MSALVPAPLSRTDIARIWRETTGGTQMDQCAEEFARRIERAAVEASAAPDLLEAMQMVRDYLVLKKGKGHDYQVIVDAAIAKATGGAA